ncbi:hypothetical protein [Methylocaldum marinum]|uniref:hypothetical protein n=1 Tax=Methylocaldum marinum TaxID=1432792 RepID=UPI0011AE2502|nr:hypothetical protein [Methylocaldum marinum]
MTKNLLLGSMLQLLIANVLGLACLDKQGHGKLVFAKEFFDFVDRKAFRFFLCNTFTHLNDGRVIACNDSVRLCPFFFYAYVGIFVLKCMMILFANDMSGRAG